MNVASFQGEKEVALLFANRSAEFKSIAALACGCGAQCEGIRGIDSGVAVGEEESSVQRIPAGLGEDLDPAPWYGGRSYSAENMSGFTRIEAIDDLGGSVLLFWNPSTVMMAWPGAPPLVAASTCSCRLKSSGSSAMPWRSWAVSVCVPAPWSASTETPLFSPTSISV